MVDFMTRGTAAALDNFLSKGREKTSASEYALRKTRHNKRLCGSKITRRLPTIRKATLGTRDVVYYDYLKQSTITQAVNSVDTDFRDNWFISRVKPHVFKWFITRFANMPDLDNPYLLDIFAKHIGEALGVTADHMMDPNAIVNLKVNDPIKMVRYIIRKIAIINDRCNSISNGVRDPEIIDDLRDFAKRDELINDLAYLKDSSLRTKVTEGNRGRIRKLFRSLNEDANSYLVTRALDLIEEVITYYSVLSWKRANSILMMLDAEAYGENHRLVCSYCRGSIYDNNNVSTENRENVSYGGEYMGEEYGVSKVPVGYNHDVQNPMGQRNPVVQGNLVEQQGEDMIHHNYGGALAKQIEYDVDNIVRQSGHNVDRSESKSGVQVPQVPSYRVVPAGQVVVPAGQVAVDREDMSNDINSQREAIFNLMDEYIRRAVASMPTPHPVQVPPAFPVNPGPMVAATA